ncbi:MAG: hypothetical protein R3313_01375 [Candidatus Saccharimonadales bacterium]|nr:hypothetical protein [Candidatus Saccharimonadales bacterium]
MINLMPSKIKNDIHFARLNTSLVQYGFIAIVVVILVAGIMLFGFTIAQDDEQALRDSIAQKESDLASLIAVEQRAGDLSRKIDTVGSLLDREIKFSTVLQEIGAILPEGANLTSLQLSSDSTEPLRVSALVDTKNSAAILRQNIEDSDRFSGADIENIVVNLDENGNPDGFAVTVIAVPSNLTGLITPEEPANE